MYKNINSLQDKQIKINLNARQLKYFNYNLANISETPMWNAAIYTHHNNWFYEKNAIWIFITHSKKKKRVSSFDPFSGFYFL